MFFDYPSDRETFDFIIKSAKPKGLHFMNFEPKIFDEITLLNTFNGMIKFACNNNNGKVEFVRCASFLGKSFEVVKSLLDLFVEFGLYRNFSKNGQLLHVVSAKNLENASKILKVRNMSRYLNLRRNVICSAKVCWKMIWNRLFTAGKFYTKIILWKRN